MRTMQDKILAEIEDTVKITLPISAFPSREVVVHQQSGPKSNTGQLFVMLGPVAVLRIGFSFGIDALRIEYAGDAAGKSTTLKSDHRGIKGRGASGFTTYTNIPYLDSEALRTKVYGMIHAILKEGVVMQRRGEWHPEEHDHGSGRLTKP